jgi:aspartyl-tRNA(Asn)/glutamyl-tRNA(Gln) amidotransferase subunit A
MTHKLARSRPMTDLTRLTIAEARTKLKAREFSAAELTDAYLSQSTQPTSV